MNRTRILVAAVVSLLLALLASNFVYEQFKRATAVKPVQLQQVVVAAVPAPLGTRLQPQLLSLASWPANSALPGSFSKIEDCVDRALLTSVVQGEPILEAKLASKEAGAGLAAVLPEGMRAVSVRVDDVVAVAGFVLPGTVVDVLVTGQPPGGDQSVTHTILERIRVLAAGQRVEQDKEGKPQTVSVITLLVTPEQADTLTMASTQGRIQLALRNLTDTKIVNPPPFYLASLYAGGAPRAKPKPAGPRIQTVQTPPPSRPAYVVEVINGNKRETSSFVAP